MEFDASIHQNKKSRPTLKPNLDILARASLLSKGRQDEKIANNPDVYIPVEQRFNISSKKFDIIPCEFQGVKSNVKYFLAKLEPNTLFNNLVINIPNPNNLALNDLVQSIVISNGGVQMYKLDGDIQTHISVLSQFLNSSCKFDPIALSTEISLGLIHSTGLIAKYQYHDLVFKIETTTPDPFNIIFRANLYTAKEFDGTDPWMSLDPTDTNIYSEQRKFRKFLTNETQSRTGCVVNQRETLPFNHPVNVIYLTSIDPNQVEHICLRVNGEPIINMDKSELYQTNKHYYLIDSNQIIMVINPNFLTLNDSSINFSRVDRVDLEVHMTQPTQPTYTVNVLSTNVLGIDTNCLSMYFFTN